MKRMKTVAVCLLALVMVLTLCGCGDEAPAPAASSGEYRDLEAMLDKGQYDAAITWIETLRENSERVVETIDQDEQTRELMARMVGDYSLRPYLYFEEGYAPTMSVQEDMTITMGGKSYVFEVRNVDRDKNAVFVSVNYRDVNQAGDVFDNFMAFTLYDSGYTTCLDAYQKNDYVDALSAELLPTLVGTYKNSYDDKTIVVREDGTVELNGAVHPLMFQPRWDDQTQLNIQYPTDDSRMDSLEVSYDSYGVLRLNWDYYRASDLEMVTLTGENLMDYFEWTDWEVVSVNKNAFGEVNDVSVSRFLKLKDAYTATLFTKETSIAMEVGYQQVAYRTADVTWNPETNAVTVTLPEDHQNYDETSTILSHLNSKSVQTDEGSELAFYYLAEVNLYANIREDSVMDETGSYQLPVEWFYDRYATNGMTVLRSESVLAFAK